MSILDNIASWSDEEIVANLKALIPPGWKFLVRGSEPFLLEASILEKDEEVCWEGSGYDRHILLLDAYGWLYRRSRTTPLHPLWERHRDDFRVPIKVQSDSGPLPGDLDPIEISTVYSTFTQKKPI